MFASEWRADSQALASDGQYWRSVFGGARLVLGTIRCTPGVFAAFRLMLMVLTGLVFFLEATREHRYFDFYWFLYFHHWVNILQVFYFVMAASLTIISVCTAGSGGIARSTPFVVRITELAYGAVLPASLVNALNCFCVLYVNETHCVSRADRSDQLHLAAISIAGLVIVVIDAGFSRQPYYASFHAIVGMIFCWSYLIFSALYELLGGTDEYGHGYIYRCLDWSYPVIGGLYNAEGKMMILNFFVLIPLINWLYWLLIWARRRTLTIYKKAAEPMVSALTNTPRPPTSRRIFFEYSADYRDLALDGRHWRAQFGGSSSPKSPNMGAYICCDATFYPFFRVALAGFAVCFLGVRLGQFHDAGHPLEDLFLYFENWTLALASFYFSLAAVLTTYVTCTPGSEASSTPIIVWIVWAAYGALLPATILNALMFIFITKRYSISGAQVSSGDDLDRIYDVIDVYGILVMTILDAWINRQPYYATFHSVCGVFMCWGYLLFNIIFVGLGGTNETGDHFIYRTLEWRFRSLDQFITPGKVTVVEFFFFIPFFNMLYWCMLWARRRARVAAKQSAV